MIGTRSIEISERLELLQNLVRKAAVYSKFVSENLLVSKPSTSEAPNNNECLQKTPSLITGCELRDYQLVGLEWLISLYENGLNGILGDEMGLGKTLQTISFLAHLRQKGTNGPFLIVAPLSTLSNWHAEFQRFCPSFPCLVYHGTETVRAKFRKGNLHPHALTGPKFPVLITSYEMIIKDRKHLKDICWKYIIVDEGHRLKNNDTKLMDNLKQYKSANRLLLTGTPLQNNLSELWSLLNFLMPAIFNDLLAFEEWFSFENDMKSDDQEKSISKKVSNSISILHQILAPFLLRRTKAEVMISLPRKREYLLTAPMMPKQKHFYEAIINRRLAETLTEHFQGKIGLFEPATQLKIVDYAEKDEDDLSHPALTLKENAVQEKNSKNLSSAKASAHFIKKLVGSQSLQMMVMQLRKVCNHPYLFQIQTDNVENPSVNGIPEILAWSGKMMLLDRLLPALIEKGHKVLIFSQMTNMLNIIEDYLTFVRKISFCRIDGSVSLSERTTEIASFQDSKQDFKVFLLSTRAGGLGLNLVAADTVIIFDSDWNPQVDLQAQDRVHRFGQSKPVIIYRFLAADSIEKRILERARAKRTLEKIVIHKNKFKGRKRTNDSIEVEDVDLDKIIEEERKSLLSLNSESGAISDSDLISPQAVLSDEELTKIMDRSLEAYLKHEELIKA